MLKLKLQYFGHLMRRANSFEKTQCGERLKAGGEGDDSGWDYWMASLTQWTWVWVNSGSWWWTGKPGMLQSMGLQRVRHDWETELNWWWQTSTVKVRVLQGGLRGPPELYFCTWKLMSYNQTLHTFSWNSFLLSSFLVYFHSPKTYSKEKVLISYLVKIIWYNRFLYHPEL